MGYGSIVMSPTRKILLATDLSARSDRATDRAASLMHEWDASLVIVHVLDPAAKTTLSEMELAARARRELSEQLQGPGERVAIRIERGEPVDVIRHVARDERCSLIVTGVARNESFGRTKVGDTVEGVIRGLETPLLVVTDRPRGPYRSVTVAVDFSDVSRDALIAASEFFPDRRLTVFHAHDAPLSVAASDIEEYRAAHGRIARDQLREFLAKPEIPEGVRSRLAIEVEFGDPALQLVEWTESKAVEMVVLGTHGRRRIGELFLGSVAKRVLAALSCDVLLIPSRGG